MRTSLAVGLLFVPLTAAASPAHKPFHDVIWGKAPAAVAAQTPGITTISHVIYMNNCLPNGCALHPGGDDVHLRQSSIADSDVLIPAWTYGTAAWNDLVTCVQQTYAPFNIIVTDVDPGTASHSEIIVAGNSSDLNPQLTGAGGVAPFLGCGATYDNTISFMFAAEDGDQLDYLCGGAAQETSHVFGLDHELNALDPMTYLDLGSHKVFQNADAQCGETAGQPRECYSLFDPSSACAGPTQNSYQYLMDHFGPAMLGPASMTITAPLDGAWVKPGFAIQTMINDQLAISTAQLQIDGQASGQPVTTGPVVFTAPSTLAGGDHAITVNATDEEMRQVTATVNVHVVGTCSPTVKCTQPDTGCVDGFCTPLSDVSGGLGATCTGNNDCILGTCAMSGTTSLCTGTCDSSTNTCPSGFDCVASNGASGVCWPSSGGGGCSSGGPGSAGVMLGALALLVLARRRQSVTAGVAR